MEKSDVIFRSIAKLKISLTFFNNCCRETSKEEKYRPTDVNLTANDVEKGHMVISLELSGLNRARQTRHKFLNGRLMNILAQQETLKIS